MIIHNVELIEKDDMVCLSYRNNGNFEPVSVKAWKDHLQGVVIDVGAYTGLYSIAAAKLGARVIAFEPNPKVYERLLKNIDNNGVTVEAYEAAAGRKEGDCSMQVKGRPVLTSAGYVTEGGNIPMMTIDGLGETDVSAIKIDAEGYELEVLKGAVGTLMICKPLIIAEALSAEAGTEVFDFLTSCGYTTATMADDRNYIYA